ncbi:MAG: hypothetical protein WCQ80_01435 [Bacilli bacterium]
MKKKDTIPQLKLGPVNEFIAKMNRPGFVMLITFYLAILVLIIFLVSPKNANLVIQPDYEHFIFPEEVHTSIQLTPRYVYNETTQAVKLTHNVTTTTQSTFNELNVDPRLLIERFMISSYLSSNRMKYFSDRMNYQTKITHSYVVDGGEDFINPETFYTVTKYQDALGVSHTEHSKETVMIDLKDRSLFSRLNTLTHFEGEGDTATEIVDLRVNFEATEDANNYTLGTRILLNNYTHQYHIDMQSWIVSINGTAYPFVGVYGHWSQSSYYRQTNVAFPKILEPEYVYCELHYYVPGEEDSSIEEQTIRYMVRIANLPNNVSTEPTYTDEREVPVVSTIIPWDRINLIGWPILIGVAVAGVVYYTTTRKKESSSDSSTTNNQ